MPPIVLLDHKICPPELVVGEVPGTIYTGYPVRAAQFKNYLTYGSASTFFITLLLFVPCCSYRMDTLHTTALQLCKYAAEEKVNIFSVPPYTTYLIQPLDKVIFGPLKISWRQVCHQFIVSNPAVRVNKYNFSSLFSEAWIQSLTLRNIIAGFRTTGVYPSD